MSQLELDPVLVTPLRRPATRQRKRAHRVAQASPRVLKFAVGIVLAAALVTFAGRIAAFAMQPVMATWQTGQDIRDLEATVRKETSVNEQLKRDIAYLSTQSGIEQEARRRGWVKPGEVALAIVRPDAEPAQKAKPEEKPVKTASASVSERIQSVLDTCLAVFGPSRTRQ
jgi:cell division protein FtsL